MKIAVLGGSFNPIHYGHLFLAEEIYRGLDFEKIIFVPAFQPAHKEILPCIAPRDRLAMCRRATKGFSYFAVDDCEIRRGGISYMIDTLDDIRRRYNPEGKIGLVIGDDLVPGFPRWKKAEEIASRSRLVIVRRLSEQKPELPFPHEVFENRIFPLSSSEIRKRLAEDLPVRFLVPEKVFALITAKKLYHESADHR